jgi:hypothetical protein
LRVREGSRETADDPSKLDVLQIEARDDREAELVQGFCDVERIVAPHRLRASAVAKKRWVISKNVGSYRRNPAEPSLSSIV